MASINIRIDDDLKQRSFAELEKLGVTPQSFCARHSNTSPSEASYPSKQHCSARKMKYS